MSFIKDVKHFNFFFDRFYIVSPNILRECDDIYELTLNLSTYFISDLIYLIQYFEDGVKCKLFVLQVDRFIRGESMGAMMDRFLNSQPSASSYGGSSTAAIQVKQP